MDDPAGFSKDLRQPHEPSLRQLTSVQTKRKDIKYEIKQLALKFAPTKPLAPKIAGHTYIVRLCLGQRSNFNDIGRYYQLCIQHKGLGAKINRQPCNKISFITPALSQDKLVEFEQLRIYYDRLGVAYSKCGPAPNRLSQEAFAPGNSDASSSPAYLSSPFLASSPPIPFSSLPLPAVIPANSTPNRKMKRSRSEADPSTSKRTKYFDLTKPREQHHRSDSSPTSQSMKAVIDLTGSDVGGDLLRARAVRREEMQKRLASMVYGGSVDID